ncbi:MAG: VOC family protein [Spirochaetaceae bacterium]|nr:VOC family protein [Spirochaetaceae bacterium]
MSYLISGIQQIGIGIPDVEEAWRWYRCRFGMDIPIFREAAEAPYMIKYTGGKVQSRDAVLAVNLRGGGGFEIWQYTSRETVFPDSAPVLGDTGIFAARIKSDDPVVAHRYLADSGATVLGDPAVGPDGEPTFFVRDPWGNLFQIVRSEEWYKTKGHPTGGPAGALIGVSDIEKALTLYRDGLGYDTVEFDEEGTFAEWSSLNGGGGKFRRILLSRSEAPSGPFAPMFGSSSIELVQALDRKPAKIFEGRYWGDGGFIHLCFDIQGMDALGEKLAAGGYPFTVDSGTPFDMGEAAGRFTYIEDPDGTLIEFVETKKLPVMKKWGWYMDLSKRPRGKALPKIVLNALGLGRVKGGCESVKG